MMLIFVAVGGLVATYFLGLIEVGFVGAWILKH